MRVLFAGGGTGGHLYPGLAIARALVAARSDIRPFFVGARRGIERDVLPQSGFPHALLDLHPLYRTRVWENWRTMAGAVGAWRALAALHRQEPARLVVGTGGYAAGLALAFATVRGIPFVIQEQNSYPGLTVRRFARYAREIYLGFPEAAGALSAGRDTRILLTGNPIEPPPEQRPSAEGARAAWGFPTGATVVVVVGGSQGARAINDAIAAWIRSGLPPGICLVWGTGTAHHARYADLEGPSVRVQAYLSPIARAYSVADFAIARAGAIATAELCAWGIPSALVPLPTAAADHQTKNAQALEKAGAAVMIRQDALTVERLSRLADEVILAREARTALAGAAFARGRPASAETIAGRILSLIDLKQIPS